jgi:hypothetical protein
MLPDFSQAASRRGRLPEQLQSNIVKLGTICIRIEGFSLLFENTNNVGTPMVGVP